MATVHTCLADKAACDALHAKLQDALGYIMGYDDVGPIFRQDTPDDCMTVWQSLVLKGLGTLFKIEYGFPKVQTLRMKGRFVQFECDACGVFIAFNQYGWSPAPPEGAETLPFGLKQKTALQSRFHSCVKKDPWRFNNK